MKTLFISRKLLIDKDMTKVQLKDAADISAASIAKLGKGGNITTNALLKKEDKDV